MLRAETEVQREFRNALRGTFAALPHLALGSPLPAPDEPDAGLKQAGELGALAVLLSEEVGGIPDAAGEFAIFHSESGRSLLTAPFLPTALVAQAICHFGPCARGEELLGRLIAGEGSAAICGLEEPSPLQTIRDGGGGRLAGRVRAQLGVSRADAVLVIAEPSGETDALLIELPSAMVAPRCDDYRLIDGRAASDVDFTGLRFTPEMVLASGSAVHAMRAALRNLACLALGADAIGGMERMIELTAEYMQVRRQFGQPIAAFQALQHHLAEAVADLEMSQALLDAALDQFAELGQAGDAAETLAAFAAPRAIAAGERAIQIHGGIGITEEYQIGHHYRRALVNDTLLKPLHSSLADIAKSFVLA